MNYTTFLFIERNIREKKIPVVLYIELSDSRNGHNKASITRLFHFQLVTVGRLRAVIY